MGRVGDAQMHLPLRRERQEISFDEARRQDRQWNVGEIVDRRIELTDAGVDVQVIAWAPR